MIQACCPQPSSNNNSSSSSSTGLQAESNPREPVAASATTQRTQNSLQRGHCEDRESIHRFTQPRPAAARDVHAAKSDIRRVKPSVAVWPRLLMTAVARRGCVCRHYYHERPLPVRRPRRPPPSFSSPVLIPTETRPPTDRNIYNPQPIGATCHTPVRTRLSWLFVGPAHDRRLHRRGGGLAGKFNISRGAGDHASTPKISCPPSCQCSCRAQQPMTSQAIGRYAEKPCYDALVLAGSES